MRISVGYDMAMLECGHTRHLFEALSRTPGVEASFGPPTGECDAVFNAAWPAPGATRIYLGVYDPHGLPLDVENTAILDPRFFGMLPPDRKEWLLSVLRSLKNPPYISIVDHVVKGGYDALALNCDWPFRAAMRPRLGRVGYMRVDPRVPEWIFFPDWSMPKALDGFFIGNDSPDWYPLRWKINRWYESSGLRFSYNPGRQPSDPIWRTTATFDDHQRWYADALRRTKLVALCGSVFNIAVGKYFEAMASGCLVLAPVPHDAELLGFKPGVNMVEIGSDDFPDKIRYYLSHDAEREAIARRAAELCHRRHTAGARAAQLAEKIRQIRSGRTVDDVESEFDGKARAEWAAS